jgi:hypothetical protein
VFFDVHGVNVRSHILVPMSAMSCALNCNSEAFAAKFVCTLCKDWGNFQVRMTQLMDSLSNRQSLRYGTLNLAVIPEPSRTSPSRVVVPNDQPYAPMTVVQLWYKRAVRA